MERQRNNFPSGKRVRVRPTAREKRLRGMGINGVTGKAAGSHRLLISRSVMFGSLQPNGLQHARLPCPSPPPEVCSYPLSQQWHPTISSSVTPCSSCPQSFPASGSFPVSWLLAQVAKLLELQLQCSQWILRVGFLSDWLVWALFRHLVETGNATNRSRE